METTQIHANKAIQKEKIRLAQQSERDFVDRNFAVKAAATWILYPIVAVWSCFTAGSFLYTNFEKTFNSWEIALTATILLAVAIQVGLYFFMTSAVDDIYDGALSEGRASKVAFVIKAIAAVAFLFFSVASSLLGGRTSAEYYKEQTSPPDLISLDVIKNDYEKDIERQMRAMANGEKITWKGTPTRKGQKIIDEAKSEIQRLNQERSEKLDKANNDNEAIKKEWQAETNKTGIWFTSLAGLGELIQIIILIFAVNYESGGSRAVSSHVNRLVSIPDKSTDKPRQIITGAARMAPADKLLTSADKNVLTSADKSPADKLRPLSDKSRQEIEPNLSATTDKSQKVELSGPIFESVRKREYDLSEMEDLEKFKASARQWYHRSFISAGSATRLQNKNRWLEAKNILDHYGIQYWYVGKNNNRITYKNPNEQ